LLEQPSHQAPRVERCLWAGTQLAETVCDTKTIPIPLMLTFLLPRPIAGCTTTDELNNWCDMSWKVEIKVLKEGIIS